VDLLLHGVQFLGQFFVVGLQTDHAVVVRAQVGGLQFEDVGSVEFLFFFVVVQLFAKFVTFELEFGAFLVGFFFGCSVAFHETFEAGLALEHDGDFLGVALFEF
jgi:hypothetical protein